MRRRRSYLPTVAEVVAYLAQHPESRLDDVGQALGLRHASVHGRLMRAWEWGWVQPERVRDARHIAYRVTERGLRAAGVVS